MLIDIALDLNVAILFLRFSGGLPVEPLSEIISFPFGYGRQDFTFGAPLEPELVRSPPRPKAAELVVEAINQNPPAAESETTLGAEPAFAARVHALAARHGVTEIQAGLILALQELPDPTEATRAMLEFPERSAAGLPGAVRLRDLASFTQRLGEKLTQPQSLRSFLGAISDGINHRHSLVKFFLGEALEA
ncbi:MAG: hypothetical protein H7343_03225 [Undibacterium sp.]|nr:hypothetical protein [Opitutaceae bacterium]